MKRRISWRPAVGIGTPVLMLSLAAMAACSDSLSSSKDIRQVALKPPAGVTPTQVRARDALHKRNRHDWVGVAHNRALDSFRADLRKPGVLTRQLCSYFAELAMSPDLATGARVKHEPARSERAALRAKIESDLCGTRVSKARPVATSSESGAMWAAIPTEASELLSGIDAAIVQATNSYDLSVRLTPILDASSTLDSINQGLVWSAVSVAQSSYEYWETALPAFQSELDNEYGNCIRAQLDAGVSSDDARANCLNGGYQMTFGGSDGPSGVRWTNGRISCPYNIVAMGLQRVGKADKDGAIDGFWAGLIATRNVVGGLVTGAGYGAAKSGVEATKHTFDIIACVYQQ